MSEATNEQLDNRILMWRTELLDLIPDTLEAGLANPQALLNSLIADVEERARRSTARHDHDCSLHTCWRKVCVCGERHTGPHYRIVDRRLVPVEQQWRRCCE